MRIPEKKEVLGPFSGVPRNPKTLLQLWIEVEGQEDRGGREWGERATEKDTLTYWYLTYRHFLFAN